MVVSCIKYVVTNEAGVEFQSYSQRQMGHLLLLTVDTLKRIMKKKKQYNLMIKQYT